MYLTVLISFLFSVLSLIVYIYICIKKRKNYRKIFFVCIAVITFELIVFAFFPIQSSVFDLITIQALNTHNEQGNNSHIFLESISVNGTKILFPEVKEGNWIWVNETYCWMNEAKNPFFTKVTDEIILKIPAGKNRTLTFLGGIECGIAKIQTANYDKTVDFYSNSNSKIIIPIPDSSYKTILKNETWRIFKFILVHFCVYLFFELTFDLWHVPITSFVCNKRMELIFFIFSMTNIIKSTWFPGLNKYSSAFYFSSYEFGFIKRGLIGELVLYFLPFVSAEKLSQFKLYFLIAVYLILSFTLGKIIKAQKDVGIQFFFTLFICSLPSTFIFISDDLRLDIYISIIFFIAIILIYKDIFVWIIPILAALILLINETTCVYLIPSILATLFYKFIKFKRKNYLLTMLGVLGVSSCVTLMILLSKLAKRPYNIEQIISHMQMHTSVAIHKTAIEAESWDVSRVLNTMVNSMAQNYRSIAFFFLSLLPAFLLIAFMWGIVYKKWDYDIQHSRLQKLSVWLLPMSTLGVFFVMLIAIDYPRYCSFLINAEIALLFFFLCDEKIQIKYTDFNGILLKKGKNDLITLMPFCICVFYLLFGMFASTAYSTFMISRFDKFFMSVLNA